jgi:hypothetical protein
MWQEDRTVDHALAFVVGLLAVALLLWPWGLLAGIGT